MVSLIFLSILFYYCNALIHSGSLSVFKVIHGDYINKFCFDYDVSGGISGKYSFSFNTDWHELPSEEQLPVPDSYSGSSFAKPGVYLAIYDDRETVWQDTWSKWSSLSCFEKLAAAEITAYLHPQSEIGSFIESNGAITQAYRPRYWYYTIVSCNAIPTRDLFYKLHATNPNLGFQKEESMDRRHLIFIAFISCVVSAVALISFGAPGFSLVLDALKSSCKDNSRIMRDDRDESLSSTVKHPLYILAVICWIIFFMGGASEAIYRAKSIDGISEDPIGLLLFSDVVEAVGRGIMITLCILVANGWTLTRSDDESSAWLILLVHISVCAQIVCEILSIVEHDPNAVESPFQGRWGSVATTLQSFVMLVYMYNLHRTIKFFSFPQQRPFFYAFGTSTVIWCLSIPVLLIIEHLYPIWEKDRVLRFIETFARLITMCLISLWLYPSSLEVHTYFKPTIARSPVHSNQPREKHFKSLTTNESSDLSFVEMSSRQPRNTYTPIEINEYSRNGVNFV